jgi:outer membrane protein OmpA-like peptidoglycan-associated protein
VTTTTTPAAETAPAKPARDVATAAEVHEEIYFRVNSKDVASGRALERAVKWLAANSSVSVTVTGHADPTGSPDLNMQLSQSRAEAVRDFLVEKGIDASRIEVKALGDTELKYGARDGRNRRVAIDATR